MKKELISYKNPKSPISETFKTLRTNIQFMNTKKKLQSILITSTMPGEGKSWVAANLATTFAQAGKKVILIDADMRKGRLYSIFEVSPRPGLSNYLSGIDVGGEIEESEDIYNYIQETDVENLYLIAAGNIPPNPSELLVSEQMINLLDELKEIFINANIVGGLTTLKKGAIDSCPTEDEILKFKKDDLLYFNNVNTFVVFYLINEETNEVFMNDSWISALGLNYKKYVRKINEILNK